MLARLLISITPFSSTSSLHWGVRSSTSGGRSFRHFHALAHHGSCELSHSHGFSEQSALNHVESQFAYSQEVRPSLDPFRYRACTVVLGKFPNLPAHRLFKAIIRATRDEFAVDLDLHEWEILKTHQR